jgi:DNA polymerase
MASEIYGENITAKSDPRRQFGKIVELACLYGLGRFGLMKAAKKEGIIITESYAQSVIDTYRLTHASIVECWADCATAFKLCIRNEPGFSIDVGAMSFERIESAVKLVRPSGFAQYYWLPHVERVNHWDDCEARGFKTRRNSRCFGCKEEIAFIGRNQGGVMSRKTTYGGDLFQSGTQGAAADIILDGMMKCESKGFPPVMSIHDEVVCEISKTKTAPARRSHVESVCELLCDLPDWAKGLPIAAQGWMQRRFTK